MSDEGFPVAKIPTSLFDDAKVKRLWSGLAPDTAAMATAMLLYEAVHLASWRLGRRVAAWEATPEWQSDWLTATQHLIAAGLLQRTGRLPKGALERALKDRDAARAAGRKGKHRRRAAQRGIVMIIRVASDKCGVCQKPLTEKRYPDPRSTTMGHEPPLAVASRDGWLCVVERPEHLACNLAKGIKTDAEQAAR